MTVPMLELMSQALTAPYQRGMETLELSFGATSANGTTAILPYDFSAYGDLYKDQPSDPPRLPDSPRYLLVPLFTPAVSLTVTVTFQRALGAVPENTMVVIQANSKPMSGFAIPIPGPAAGITASLRLLQFQPLPQLAGPASSNWKVVALLGNLVKLMWVVGAEQTAVRDELPEVASQRNAGLAHGKSLDLLGGDLGVPRFPPTPYTWDSSTIALYHLDDQPAAPLVEDDRARYDAVVSHPGTNVGGYAGAPGKFGSAFRFSDNATFVRVPDHAEFALGAAAEFTAEAEIRPDSAVTTTGTIIAKRAVINQDSQPGWSLSIGSFRGIEHNLRFAFSDGVANAEHELFADRDLARDGAYHHVAGSLERKPGAAPMGHLYVDGAEVANISVPGIGALSNAVDIQIGYGRELVSAVIVDAQYVGLIDEVRLSSVARAAFNPVVGEADDQYRRRLTIFQRWLLPTPDAIQQALNEVAGPIQAVAKPFLVDEQTDPMVPGTATVRVLPKELEPGTGIGADGNLRTSEAAAAGRLENELDFDPAWLSRHANAAGLSFGGVDANRNMQLSVLLALDNLLSRLAPLALASPLTVVAAYDPLAPDLRRVGRALLLTHSALPPSRLAALAHAAGFDFVRHTGFGQVYVAQGRRDPFRVKPFLSGAVPQPPDAIEGGPSVVLAIDPDPAAYPDAESRWILARCGFGDANLVKIPAGGEFQPLAAGDVSVHVEVTRRRHTRGGSRIIRIGLADTGVHGLQAGHSISGAGERDVSEAQAAGMPDWPINPAFLTTAYEDYLNLAAVDFGNNPLNRRMQRCTYRALKRLLAALAGQPGRLHVLKGYDINGVGLFTVGRALQLFHDGMSTSRLASLAFAAGFDYVAIDVPGTMVQVAVAAAELITVEGPPQMEVTVGPKPALFYVDPEARPYNLCFAADGSRAYIADIGNDLLTSLTLSAPTALDFPSVTLEKSVLVGRSPTAVAASASQLYVASAVSSDVVVLDPATLATVDRFTTGRNPNAMAVDANGLHVTCSQDMKLHSYDTTTHLELIPAIQFTTFPLAIAPVPGAPAAYVVLYGNRVCQVDTVARTITATITTGLNGNSAVVVPTLPTAKLYVACAADDPARSSGTVRVYTVNNNAQVAMIGGFPAFSRPWQVSASGDGKYVYVVTAPQEPQKFGRVHIIDTATDTLLAPVFTPGTTQWWIATSPKTAQTKYLPCLLSASVESGMVTVGDPRPLPNKAPRIAGAINLGAGNGETLSWSAIPFSHGRLDLSSTSKPQVQAQGTQPGRVLMRAVYVMGSGLRPYQFEARLVPALEGQPGVFIRKEQYDLVMNLLNSFHPIGVEVKTGRLRAQVVELQGKPGDLFPAYTFPTFRARTLPAISQQEEG